MRGGVPVDLAAHLDRMQRSIEMLALPEWPNLATAVWSLFEQTFEAEGEPPRAVLRVTLMAGRGRGLVPATSPKPSLLVEVNALPEQPDLSPLRAVTVTSHRVDPAAAISGHKTLSWFPWVLARREAMARGADIGLVRTFDGDVCEADHANVFLVVGSSIVTPSLDRGVLPGITRARALTVLRQDGREVEERALTDADLASASEAWLTSSLDGVRALGSIDGRSLVAPGPLTGWLADCVNRR